MDNTYTRQNGAYSFTIDANVVTAGFERAVSSMNLHEKAKFIVPYQSLYGSSGLPASVPQKADLTYNIHLIQIIKQNGYQTKETNQVTVVEMEKEVDSENQHETQTSGVFGIAAELAMETAKNPPGQNEEHIETQLDEGIEVTEEEAQNKRESDAEEEVINILGHTNLVAYNAEKAWSQASLLPTPLQASLLPTRLLPAPSQVFYNPQSFLAKGQQVKQKT